MVTNHRDMITFRNIDHRVGEPIVFRHENCELVEWGELVSGDGFRFRQPPHRISGGVVEVRIPAWMEAGIA